MFSNGASPRSNAGTAPNTARSGLSTASPRMDEDNQANGSSIKKTITKMFSHSNWSGDGGPQPSSPSGLIAAFRSILPKSSANSASVASEDGRTMSTSSVASPHASLGPPPISPGRRSTLLAVCPQLPPSMQRAEWCFDDYVIMQKLYKGYASEVYKAMCKRSREIVVLKSYTMSSICELYQHQIYREVRLHNSLQHENIIALYAAFQEGDRVVMVQEYADGGDLFALLHKYGGRLSERIAVQMVLDPFLRVLQYLHTRSIIHRDIKPENILFVKANMCLKLADFGLAIDLHEERAVTRAGTLDYMAPEVLKCPLKSRPEENKEKEHLHYSNSVDSWAVGVLTYELLVGCPPFYDESKKNTEARIRSSMPAFPSTLSEGARDFIIEALRKDPVTRPTVLDMVHHNWIELFRARRSMRQLPLQPTGTGQAPAGAAPNGSTMAAAAAAAGSTRPTAGVKFQAAESGVEKSSSSASSAAAAAAAAARQKPNMMKFSVTSKCMGESSVLSRVQDRLASGELAVQQSAKSSPCMINAMSNLDLTSGMDGLMRSQGADRPPTGGTKGQAGSLAHSGLLSSGKMSFK